MVESSVIKKGAMLIEDDIEMESNEATDLASYLDADIPAAVSPGGGP